MNPKPTPPDLPANHVAPVDVIKINHLTHAPPDLPANLTIPQACERVFNISRSLYYKIPEAERPPTIQIGSKPFIRLTDAINWLNSKTPEGNNHD